MLLKCVNIDVFKLLHISWSLVVDRLIFQQNAQGQFWILLVLNLSVSYIIGNLEIHHICHGIGMQQGSEQRKLVVHYLPGLIALCKINIILQTTVAVLFCKSMLLIHIHTNNFSDIRSIYLLPKNNSFLLFSSSA
jgi:hypothetical protein